MNPIGAIGTFFSTLVIVAMTFAPPNAFAVTARPRIAMKPLSDEPTERIPFKFHLEFGRSHRRSFQAVTGSSSKSKNDSGFGTLSQSAKSGTLINQVAILQLDRFSNDIGKLAAATAYAVPGRYWSCKDAIILTSDKMLLPPGASRSRCMELLKPEHRKEFFSLVDRLSAATKR